MSERLERWLEVVRLKSLERAGWVRVGIDTPESVAAHSWSVAWLVLELLPEGLDLGRALAYAVLHDLPEARVGDITPHDGVSVDDKHRAERRAARALLSPPLLARWEAYEAQADPEARFVRQLDRLDMALQALAYRGMADTTAFLASARRGIREPDLMAILDAIEVRLTKRR